MGDREEQGAERREVWGKKWPLNEWEEERREQRSGESGGRTPGLGGAEDQRVWTGQKKSTR